MARPTKIGLEYFSVDVDFDVQLEIVISKHGDKSLAVIIRLWQHIYKRYGYFMPFNDDELYIFKRSLTDTSMEEIKNIIDSMIEKNLFNKKMYDEQQVLTSGRLQENYIDATSRRVNVNINPSYCVINVDNGSTENTQSKVNKSKVDESESKVEKSKVLTDLPSSDSVPIVSETFDYNRVINYFNEHSLLKPIKKLTDKRRAHLHSRIKEYSYDDLFTVVDNIKESSFLRGSNNRQWVATFDWVFGHPNNFIKVLEGNYNDKKEPGISNNLTNRADELKRKYGDGQ